MNDDLAQTAYELGWLQAQIGLVRESGFIGDELCRAWVRGYDDFKAGLPMRQAEEQKAA